MLRIYLAAILILLQFSCEEKQVNTDAAVLRADESYKRGKESYFGKKVLLANRFESLEELKEYLSFKYDSTKGLLSKKSYVSIAHSNHLDTVVAILESGVSQQDIVNARDSSFYDKLYLLVESPYAISNRVEMAEIYLLSRRRRGVFGWGDVAFYDLALNSVENIHREEGKYLESDFGEKGFINTFNHFIAQAFITILFSEDLADYIADVHERYNLKELISGDFSNLEFENGQTPIDNYVDLINNEWGQEFGKVLKSKYSLSNQTIWDEKLLALVLNDIQAYFTWSFEISMNPFREDDEVIKRFVYKLNKLNDQEFQQYKKY